MCISVTFQVETPRQSITESYGTNINKAATVTTDQLYFKYHNLIYRQRYKFRFENDLFMHYQA